MPSGLEATQCTAIFKKSATKKMLEAENRKYISKETDKKKSI